MSRFARLLAAVLALALYPQLASAHDVRTTQLLLDLGQTVAQVELRIPVEPLALALQGTARQSANVSDVMRYVGEHLSAKAPDGRAFALRMESADIERMGDGDNLVVSARLEAPAGASVRSFVLFYDGVVHRVVTHDVQIFVRRDLQGGVFEGKPHALGSLHYQRNSLAVDRSDGGFWTGFRTMFALGTRHIVEGTDHVLFLLLLLLPAALRSEAGRWSTRGSVRRSLTQTLKIVTAFTVGHSLTLAAGAGLGLRLPSRFVEVAIAVSILVSAAHALRPLFAGKEPLVAGAFGLVHGLAFAASLDGIGLDGWTLLQSLLGFNLGIEAMQLGVVVITLPWLVLLSRGPSYEIVRQAAAVFGALGAVGWILERGFGWTTPLPGAVELVARQFPWLVAALASGSLFERWRRRASSGGKPSAAPL